MLLRDNWRWTVVYQFVSAFGRENTVAVEFHCWNFQAVLSDTGSVFLKSGLKIPHPEPASKRLQRAPILTSLQRGIAKARGQGGERQLPRRPEMDAWSQRWPRRWEGTWAGGAMVGGLIWCLFSGFER